VVSKAECDQLNLTQREETQNKQTPVTHIVQYRSRSVKIYAECTIGIKAT